jgi:hypothetical protein
MLLFYINLSSKIRWWGIFYFPFYFVVYSIDFQSWTWAMSYGFICSTMTQIRTFPPPPTPPRPGGGGGWGMLLSYSWKEGTLVYRQNGGAVLLVNVFVKLSSPAPTRDPWQSPDCIPIVGSAKPLVLNDKRFNHTKVWCTFMFIDLQATRVLKLLHYKECIAENYHHYADP